MGEVGWLGVESVEGGMCSAGFGWWLEKEH